MYTNTDAIIRPELQAVVQEAAEANKFFIADRVFPHFASGSKTGEYRRIKKGSGGVLEMTDSDQTKRAPRAPYKEVDRTYEKDNFACVDRGLTEVVDDSDARDLARFFDAESVSSKLLLENILRGQEKRVADVVMDPAIWGSANPKVDYTEANIATIDPAYDFEAAIAAVQKRGELVNTIVLSRSLWSRIRRSTLLRKYIYGDNAGDKMITRDVFLSAFQDTAPITQLLIAEAVYSTAKKGVAVADNKISYIWGDAYIWIGNVSGGAPEMGGAGRTIYWEEDAAFNYVVESYRDEPRRSDVIRVRQHNTEKVINENAGTLIKTNFA